MAFVGFVAAFAWELFAYQRKVVDWAKRDLQSRADLAANMLEEPLRTQDFRRLHAFGDRVRADGYRLSVFDSNGHGRVFDTDRNPEADSSQFYADQKSDGYLVRLWVPASQVMKPFSRALIGVTLAGLVGIAGVLLFFFVTYRQRVRIRELKRTEAFRRAFIADLSHEIKTPLTGILGAVDLLDGESPLFGMIRTSARRLNGLVQSILDLARLERDGEIVMRAETELVGLVREVVDEQRLSAEASGVTLTLRPFEGADGAIRVSVDARLLAQAVANLVANAIRHSGSPDVVVSLSAEARVVRISVEDHGCGIPPEHVERVFERFYRVDPSRAAETGGAGLGLAIVRRIARLHGGDVVCEAVQPTGARFVLTIAR